MPLWLAIIIAAAVTIGSGFSLRFFHERKVARHQRKIDDRLAVGEDRYFEELRELRAYDPRDNPPCKNVTLELLSLAGFFVGLAVALTSWQAW